MEDNVVPTTPMQFYRSTAVGIALTTSLNTMIEAKEITIDDARNILHSFDVNVESTIRKSLCPKKRLSVMEMEGTLSCYNNFEDLWKIDASDVSYKFENGPPLSSNKRVRFLFMK